MRIAVVSVGPIPNTSSGGGALTIWSVATYLAERGHEVTAVVVRDPPDSRGIELEERLRACGVDVRQIPSLAPGLSSRPRTRVEHVWRTWRPELIDLYPYLADAPAVAEMLREVEAEVVFAYHWEALAASRGVIGEVPRFGVAVDLPHLSTEFRARLSPRRLSRATLLQRLWVRGQLRRQPAAIVQLLGECDGQAEFAPHHAAWLRKAGVPGCAYMRTPIEDLGADPASRNETQRLPGDPLRVLLMGHLRGVSTLDGLDLFATEVLPLLERDLGERGLDVRVVGAYDPEAAIVRLLRRPSVTLLGHLDDPAEEFANAHVLVVPTSIPLGVRVRILAAWSYGCPVVTHVANAQGIPEIADRENALVAQSGAGLAAAAIELARDDELRRKLGAGGRTTFEQFFHPDVAGAAIETRLQELAAHTVRV